MSGEALNNVGRLLATLGDYDEETLWEFLTAEAKSERPRLYVMQRLYHRVSALRFAREMRYYNIPTKSKKEKA